LKFAPVLAKDELDASEQQTSKRLASASNPAATSQLPLQRFRPLDAEGGK
jgi:hypothetical protein